MGFAQDQGYIPQTIAEIMEAVRVNINAQFGTTYIAENFVGTNWYKYFYSMAQRMQENEVKTSEIFLKMQEYFTVTNERVLRPNTTNPGIVDYLASYGFLASTKKPINDDAGKLFVCVDVDETADDYADTKETIGNLIKNCCVAGVVSQGTEEVTITLDNSQSFDFKFNLPDRIPVLLKLTITLSDNNLFAVSDPLVVRQALFDNIEAKYKLGKNFEPQRYFSVVDAPWASQVLLEYSVDDGENYSSAIFESDYDELFTFDIEDITIVEN